MLQHLAGNSASPPELLLWLQEVSAEPELVAHRADLVAMLRQPGARPKPC